MPILVSKGQLFISIKHSELHYERNWGFLVLQSGFWSTWGMFSLLAQSLRNFYVVRKAALPLTSTNLPLMTQPSSSGNRGVCGRVCTLVMPCCAQAVHAACFGKLVWNMMVQVAMISTVLLCVTTLSLTLNRSPFRPQRSCSLQFLFEQLTSLVCACNLSYLRSRISKGSYPSLWWGSLLWHPPSTACWALKETNCKSNTQSYVSY